MRFVFLYLHLFSAIEHVSQRKMLLNMLIVVIVVVLLIIITVVVVVVIIIIIIIIIIILPVSARGDQIPTSTDVRIRPRGYAALMGLELNEETGEVWTEGASLE